MGGVVSACVLRATTKKIVNFFLLFEKKCIPEKILATPINLPTPGKIVRAPMAIRLVYVPENVDNIVKNALPGRVHATGVRLTTVLQ